MATTSLKTINTKKEKKCPKCREVKSLSEFGIRKSGRPYGYCKPCNIKHVTEWRQNNREKMNATRLTRLHLMGICRPYSESKDCPLYLGVHISERVISKIFKNVKRMPINNPGYDLTCEKNYKIDVKSSCLRHREHRTPYWHFRIRHNMIAEYFCLIAFDSRKLLNPMHVWLIPSNVINILNDLIILDTKTHLSKWSKYEQPLDKILKCCNSMREEI